MEEIRTGEFQASPPYTKIEINGIASEATSHGLESTQVKDRGVPVIPDTMNKPGIVAMTAALSKTGDGHVTAEELFARPLDAGM